MVDRRLATLSAILLARLRYVGACTSIGVTPSATTDGSTMTTHTVDCQNCDFRQVYIEARDWPEGTMKPIYVHKAEYPRYVVDTRSVIYAAIDGQQPQELLGYIPQVSHTYGYWENHYAYANEHGLTIGESTCAANFQSTSDTAMMSIRELTQIAMERCRTARCAVESMGRVAERYGFYGEDPGYPGGGESLTVGDGREVWVFHITGEPSGRSAFWAAQRIPDGHVAVVANAFVIRKVQCDHHDEFLCSTDLPRKALAAKVWDGKGSLDWNKAMGPDLRNFSYTPGFSPIPLYTTARLWRVFSLLAPSIRMKLTVNAYDYPFSVPVDRKLNARELMDIQRDHYEGTEIDMTVGALAGPFGSPNRLFKGVGLQHHGGQFARAISIHRTSTAQLGQSFGGGLHSDAPHAISKLWMAADSPASTVYVPFYIGVSDIDASYQTGSQQKYEDSVAWWVFNFVANYMDLNYRLMNIDVKAKIEELQDEIDKERSEVEASALELLRRGEVDSAANVLGMFQVETQRHVVKTWREFGHFLIMKFNDQFINYPDIGTDIGYPAWWLQMFGVSDDIRPKWATPSATPPADYTLYGSGPFEQILSPLVSQAVTLSSAQQFAPVSEGGVSALTLTFSCTACLLAGALFGRRSSVGRANDACQSDAGSFFQKL